VGSAAHFRAASMAARVRLSSGSVFSKMDSTRSAQSQAKMTRF
jgi:hypothetical protein